MKPLEALKGVGTSILKKLNKAGIENVVDLLLHLPKDYEDRQKITPISDTFHGQKNQIQGVIRQVNINYQGKKILTCQISDQTGACRLRFFNFYPSHTKLLQEGKTILCFGEISRTNHGIEMIHPEWKIIEPLLQESTASTITPLYSKIEGIGSVTLYKLISQLKNDLPNLPDLLPTTLQKQFGLLPIQQALLTIHFPTGKTLHEVRQQVDIAHYQLALEEMLAHNLSAQKNRQLNQTDPSPPIMIKPSKFQAFLKLLPFKPTNAQQRVINEIFTDFTTDKPASRLIQGDVGSGKTVVAAAALIQAAFNSLQSVIMAPTEILAEQHFQTLSNWFKILNIPIVFVAQKLTAKKRRQALEIIEHNENCVIVGTHAVFQDKVQYTNLGLVIIDEQHRFGVEQRLSLIKKSSTKSWQPHQIIMTATPIPRTLAMTVYGDLDISIIDELPPNRKPIKTSVLNQNKQQILIERLEDHIRNEGQAYWVCPLIESSEVLVTLQDAESLFEMIKTMLPDARTGLIHGKLKAAEKTQLMKEFKAHELDLLVATTVIEVGVDVPNANIMIIDNAERLGLSQLHQLRGRVGRGSKESRCVLLYKNPLGKTAKKRLELMRQTQDGFLIAEEDLKLRGPGDIFGKNQTGDIRFKVANLSQHQLLFQEVTTLADILMTQYPERITPIITRWLSKSDEYIKA